MQDTDATRIWRKRVAQWRRSRLTAEQFCAREGLAAVPARAERGLIVDNVPGSARGPRA
jgi:hypothetical protein